MRTSTATDLTAAVMGEQQDIEQRRMRVVRTVWVLAIIAGLIFVAFILSGVLGN